MTPRPGVRAVRKTRTEKGEPMTRKIATLLLTAALLALAAAPVLAEDPAKVPDRYKWDLSVLYANDAAWDAAKRDVETRAAALDTLKGTLGRSAKDLKTGLDLVWGLQKDLYRLNAYASQKSDLNVADSKAMALRQSMSPLDASISARMAWVDPEILSIPEGKLKGFLAEEPGLLPYKPVLDDVLRLKAHTLSPAEEKILADAGLLSDAAESVYTVFSDAEIPRSSVTLSDGTTVTLDAAAYTQYRAAADRQDRERVFQAFFANLHQFRGTFGALLNTQAKRDLFRAKARGYDSCIASALDGPNVPVAVYENLIRNVHKNLPTLHRYLRLRQRMMGLSELRYSDLYASIVKEVDQKYTADQAMDLTLKAVAPLGKDYAETLGKGFQDRWVDWFPYEGKHSGAYSGGAYGAHPFILTNFNGTYEDVSTLAHEAGHAMHSHYSNGAQPFQTSDYTIFVAEVASTFNEAMLTDYMLKHTDDDSVKLFLLGSYVDGIRQTLFRQTQFAEFEWEMHKAVERGEALTGDSLDAMYKKIIDEYYGVDQGITVINPVCYSEWAYIPHFYYNFYVYSYSTSLTASTALSQMVLEGRPGAVERYKKFLSLGNSMPPVEELKVAGVDMTTDEPFTITMDAMNKAMDQMETILARMEKAKAPKK